MLHWQLDNIEYFLYFISLIIYLISSNENVFWFCVRMILLLVIPDREYYSTIKCIWIDNHLFLKEFEEKCMVHIKIFWLQVLWIWRWVWSSRLTLEIWFKSEKWKTPKSRWQSWDIVCFSNFVWLEKSIKLIE